MKKLLIGGVLAALLATPALSQTPPPEPAPRGFAVVAKDPAFSALVSPQAKLEVLGDRYGLTEGPLWVPEGKDGGFIVFADLISNVIWKYKPGEGNSVFLDKAGYSGDDILNAGTQTKRGRAAVLMIGPNGMTLDDEGRVIWCAPPDGAIMRLEKDGSRTVIAKSYEGKRFSGVNDIARRSDGALYVTDSVFGLRGAFKSPQRELQFNGVYLIKDGKVTLLTSDEGKPGAWPNGVTLSPDEKHLYLNEGFQNIVRYDVKPYGTVANRTVFITGEGSDGMKVDTKGNLWTTSGAGPGEVRITAPDGKRLGVIELPIPAGEPKRQICATNIAFGDPDGKGLYITACEEVYRVRVNVAGVRPLPK